MESMGSSISDYITKLKSDMKFRRIFTIFIWSCVIFFVLGWNMGQAGPTLLDLQIVSSSSLEQASLLFTAFASGYVLSSFMIGLIFHKFDQLLYIIFGNLGGTVVMASIPWCKQYELMFTMHVLKGFTCGVGDTVATALLIQLLGQDCRPYVQFLHLFFTFGGIFSPLATAPFLTPINETNDMGDIKYNETKLLPYVTLTEELDGSNESSTYSEQSITTDVYKAYLISAGLCLLSVVPFSVMYFKFDKNLTLSKDKNDKSEASASNDCLPKVMRLPVLVTIACISAVYTAIHDSFSGFLATFAVNQFGFEKTLASYVTSLYWTCFAAGSVFGIFISPFFELSKFLCFYSLMIMTNFIFLLFVTLYTIDAGVWITAVMNGIFMSVFFPLFYAWTEEDFLHVSAKVTALISISASVGVIVNPVILGQLMALSPIWFCFVLLGESILLVLLFVIGVILSKKTRQIRRLSKYEVNINVSDSDEVATNIFIVEQLTEVTKL